VGPFSMITVGAFSIDKHNLEAELSKTTAYTPKYPEFPSLCGSLPMGYQAPGSDQKLRSI
jgi:hypothetical protein